MKHLILFCFSICFLQKLVAQPILFKEDFDNNQNKWQLANYANCKSSIENGSYILDYKAQNNFYMFRKAVNIYPGRDFYIEAKMTQLKGITNHGFGLIWGTADVDNALAFVVSIDGQFSIYQYKSGRRVSIAGWTKSKAIQRKNKPNVLAIRQSYGQTTFLLNGQELTTITSPSFMGQNIGFIVNNTMKVAVDYIFVKQEKVEVNLIDNPINGFVKENLGNKVNSKYDEVAPIISPDGKQLYMARYGDPSNVVHQYDADNTVDVHASDIWFSQKDAKGEWSYSVNIGKPLNNDASNWVISVAPDGNSLLLGNTYNADGSSKGIGFSITRRTTSGWSVPEDIFIHNYYNKNTYASAFLSSDNKTLLLGIEQDDSRGDQDLYVSFRQSDGSFSDAVNLGEIVNTFAADFAPFLAADGVTLYFSSSGHPGYGDADVFMCKRLDDTWKNWTKPRNLGSEINTPVWDAYYTLPASGDYAYFVSSENSLGNGDVFRIKLPQSAKPQPVMLIYGKVLNSKTKEPLSANIEYSDLLTNKVLGSAISNPNDGSYKIVLPYNRAYSLLAAKDLFYAVSQTVDALNVDKYQEIEYNLYLAPIEVGESIRLNNIFFDYDKSSLRPESFPELDRLADLMQRTPGMVVEIGGHTDDSGSDSYNLALSDSRAKSVADYLRYKGIATDRISSRGYGETVPVAPNNTDSGKAYNRRVEFKIIKM